MVCTDRCRLILLSDQMGGYRRMQRLIAAATILTALTAFTSLITTWYVIRLDGQRSKSDVFFRLTAVINSDDMRRKRREVYSLSRNEFSKWTPEQRSAVDDWLACLDLSLTLYKANAINRDVYMYMFGDVTLRTVYQVVPYCNSEVDARGDQFLIPMRLAIAGVDIHQFLTVSSIIFWKVLPLRIVSCL